MYEQKYKSDYEIILGDYSLPILPENLKEILQIDNKKYDTFGAGERVLPGTEKLHTWTISSYFPADGDIRPDEYKDYYMGLVHREYVKNKTTEPILPLEFTVIRYYEDGKAVAPIVVNVLFESIEWEARKGEPGDIYYTFKLIEYKDFGTDVK